MVLEQPQLLEFWVEVTAFFVIRMSVTDSVVGLAKSPEVGGVMNFGRAGVG